MKTTRMERVFKMHRFFVSADDIRGDIAYIDKQEARHIKKVLRLKAGDEVILFDGSGQEYRALLMESGNNVLSARITEISIKEDSPDISLCLVQGIAKGDKMDNIIQKATEIGAAVIYPLSSERTIVRLQGDNAVKKVSRWQHIAREACKQCRRNVVPLIKPVMEIDQVCQEIGEFPALMLYENEQNNRLRQVLNSIKETVLANGKIFLIVGPEGGFSEVEVEKARIQGVKIASLGPRILRTETAGIAASSIIMYEYDLM
ncbi:ribosomal rna small subunit methyltransferase e [hydrocarbon metagenome]|uniref:16S rRNA (uracil(1498)-N(3))-methyltransferase n=1 Tax=hydrocarbon metagenome TaxID=938273 RepID=A0A0W8E6M0_9ZZZZ